MKEDSRERGGPSRVYSISSRSASAETRTGEKEKGEDRRVPPPIRSVETFQGNVGGTPVKGIAVRSF